MKREDLVRIDEAARIVGRTVWTVRWWSKRGFAPTGTKLRVYRDRATKIRYFARAEIERIAAELYSPAAA